MPSIFDALIATTKVREVTDLIDAIQESRRIAWKPVGENDNNLAIINLGSDPAAGVVERITNAFDAVLELEWITRGQPAHLMSPRAAVAEWFGLPEGRLARVEDLRAPEIASLTDRVQVTIRDSERSDRPTLDVRDTGVGLRAEEFGGTILSLNKSRKLRKLFLAGAFGQGGSTALAYSQYTLIVSRARSATGASGGRPRLAPVALTVVRFNAGDVRTDKHGVYEYMVDHATGHPITVEVPERTFPRGTLVRHVAMDLGKYKNILTAPTGSPWYLVHNYLFDPVLPFRIEEARANAVQGNKRTVAGNFRLLTQSEHTEYQRSAALTFRDGTVTVTWWVLSADGEDSRNRITQYVMPSKPVVVTYNGQKQGELPNTIVKNDLRLPYLERYLVVHVDCDKLDNEARRLLFPTTREALRDSAIGDELRKLVVDTLAGDAELQRLDRERKQRYIRRVESASVENIRRRLANRVRSVVLAGAGGRGPRALPPDAATVTTTPPPVAVQEPPTLLEIVSPEPRKVYPGRRFTLRFRTDADPAYFLNPDTFIAIIDPPTFGQYTGTTNVRNGHGTAYFAAADDIEVGATALITMEVRPRRATSLRATTHTEAAPLPAQVGTGEGRAPTPNINPVWVTQGEAFWTEHNWTTASVAKVIRTEESVDIFVSADNRKLSALIVKAQRRDAATVEAVKDFYLEHISFYALLADLDQERLARVRSGDGTTPEPQTLEMEVDRELERACEMLCGVAEDLFEVVAGRATDGDAAEHGVVTEHDAEVDELTVPTEVL